MPQGEAGRLVVVWARFLELPGPGMIGGTAGAAPSMTTSPRQGAFVEARPPDDSYSSASGTTGGTGPARSAVSEIIGIDSSLEGLLQATTARRCPSRWGSSTGSRGASRGCRVTIPRLRKHPDSRVFSAVNIHVLYETPCSTSVHAPARPGTNPSCLHETQAPSAQSFLPELRNRPRGRLPG